MIEIRLIYSSDKNNPNLNCLRLIGLKKLNSGINKSHSDSVLLFVSMSYPKLLFMKLLLKDATIEQLSYVRYLYVGTDTIYDSLQFIRDNRLTHSKLADIINLWELST